VEGWATEAPDPVSEKSDLETESTWSEENPPIPPIPEQMTGDDSFDDLPF
jgi:hypothetical protein